MSKQVELMADIKKALEECYDGQVGFAEDDAGPFLVVQYDGLYSVRIEPFEGEMPEFNSHDVVGL